MGAAMSDEAAAWIREHVWTKGMRKTFKEIPGYFLKCACQFAMTTRCQIGQHGKCHRATPLVAYEACILRPGGIYPALFEDPMFHRTPTAVGGQRAHAAQVWLADRVCRWLCPCDCHAANGVPEQRIDKPVQLDLFAALTA